MSYTKQTWDTTSYVTPTRMNHIESGIADDCVQKTGDTMTGVLNISPETTNDALVIKRTHTNTQSQMAEAVLGNNIPEGTAGSCYGAIALWAKSAKFARVQATNITGDRTLELPDKSGTLVITDDIPLESISGDYSGDLNNFKCGMVLTNNQTTNVPDTSNAAWIVFSDVKLYEGNAFGIQLAFGFNPSVIYARRRWATWKEWKRIDNV